MSDAKIITLADLPTAIPAAGTDTFAVCQSLTGCGPEDNLVQMSLAQLADFVISEVPSYRYVSQIIPSTQQVPLVNGTVVQLASIALTPGEWLISAEVWFKLLSGNAANVQQLGAALTDQVNALPTEPADNVAMTVTAPANVGVGTILPLTSLYVNTDVDINYYLNVQSNWTSNISMAAYGKIVGLNR